MRGYKRIALFYNDKLSYYHVPHEELKRVKERLKPYIQDFPQRGADESVGEFLKRVRNKHGLSARELGDIIGCSRDYIANIESNRKRVSARLKRKLSSYFEIDHVDLYDPERG